MANITIFRQHSLILVIVQFIAIKRITSTKRESGRMKSETKTKQIVVRFDLRSYEKITQYAVAEHRGFGDFVRHATLYCIEKLDKEQYSAKENKEEG